MFGSKSCVLSDKISFEVFSPTWFHVNENEKKKKLAKIQNLNFTNIYKILVQTHPRSKVCMDFLE